MPTERPFAAVWCASALGCAVLAPLAPFLAALGPPCLFKSLTGLPCPLCGTTRAALALARFDVVGGFLQFPLPTLLWIGFLGGGLVAGASVLAGRPLPAPRRFPRWAGIALAGAFLVNWVYSVATGV